MSSATAFGRVIRAITVAGSLCALGIAVAALGGCTAPHPYISEGDQKSVAVAYGGRIDDALPLARQYCARFERTPKLVDSAPDVAYFDCVPQ